MARQKKAWKCSLEQWKDFCEAHMVTGDKATWTDGSGTGKKYRAVCNENELSIDEVTEW